MKVVAGKFKGRNLVENKFEHIRPTADMVRQALFNKLNFVIKSAKVLDLCAGTGALGIEALSRGASEVVFVDKDSRSLGLIKQNLANLGCNENFKIVKSDAVKFCQDCKEKFDIIIFDPPYKSNLYLPVIEGIFNSKMLTQDGIIAVEHSKDDSFQFDKFFEVIDQKTYGIKQITYLKLSNNVE